MTRKLTLTTNRLRLTLRDEADGPADGQTVLSPRDAHTVARLIADAATSDEAVEVILAVMLDARAKVTGFAEVARGTVNCSRFVAADVLRPVLLSGATSYVLTHNHPSGDVTPSRADRRVTGLLRAMSRDLGVQLVDHIIVGSAGAWLSMSEIEQWQEGDM